MLQQVELTFAERVCLAHALERQRGDLETARNVREIRSRLELREATRILDKINLSLARINRRASWDEIQQAFKPLQDWIVDQLERVEDATVREVLNEVYDRTMHINTSTRVLTIDSAYIRWIRDQVLAGLDWSVVTVRGPQGIREEKVPVELGLMEVFASLDEALSKAEKIKSS